MDSNELIVKMLDDFKKDNAHEHKLIMNRIDAFEKNFIMINLSSLKNITIGKKQGGILGGIFSLIIILNQAGVI